MRGERTAGAAALGLMLITAWLTLLVLQAVALSD
jgi:hypothetical protein